MFVQVYRSTLYDHETRKSHKLVAISDRPLSLKIRMELVLTWSVD